MQASTLPITINSSRPNSKSLAESNAIVHDDSDLLIRADDPLIHPAIDENMFIRKIAGTLNSNSAFVNTETNDAASTLQTL